MQNLHCSEVARWTGNAAATLAGLRAALAPGGECVLESTPNGAYGCFYEEWIKSIESQSGDEETQSGDKKRMPQLRDGLILAKVGKPPQPTASVRHFFPWWLEEAYTDALRSPTPHRRRRS